MKVLFKLLIISLFLASGLEFFAQYNMVEARSLDSFDTDFKELKKGNTSQGCDTLQKLNDCLVTHIKTRTTYSFASDADIRKLIDLGASAELIQLIVKTGRDNLFSQVRGYIYHSDDIEDIEYLSRAKAVLEKAEINETLTQFGYYTSKRERDEFLNSIRSLQEEVYIRSGRIYFNAGQTDLAMKEYNSGIRLNPNSATAYYNRGNTYADKKEFAQSIDDYNKAIELNPTIADIYVYRGNIYLRIKQFDLAIKDFTKAIVINPNFVLAYYYRGLAYLGLKENSKAIRDFTEVLSLELDFADAYYNRGHGYQLIGEKEKANKDFEIYERLSKNRF